MNEPSTQIVNDEQDSLQNDGATTAETQTDATTEESPYKQLVEGTSEEKPEDTVDVKALLEKTAALEKRINEADFTIVGLKEENRKLKNSGDDEKGHTPTVEEISNKVRESLIKDQEARDIETELSKVSDQYKRAAIKNALKNITGGSVLERISIATGYVESLVPKTAKPSTDETVTAASATQSSEKTDAFTESFLKKIPKV